MRVVVLGTGMIGNLVVCEIAKSEAVADVLAVDGLQKNLDQCVSQANNTKVKGKLAQLNEVEGLTDVMREADIAIACLPHSLSFLAVQAAISAKCHLVDLVGSQYVEKEKLNGAAQDSNVLIVPGCGVAPGIVNALAARGAELLDEADEVTMICGGLPRHPKPPLWYQVVFRLESVMKLYTRPALAAENGKIIELPPLSGLEDIHFPEPVGACEAVITDAHSVPHTLKNKVKKIYEKTVRYKGHWTKMGVLAELGFLDEKTLNIDGIMISPQQVTTALLEPKLKSGSIEDTTVLRVIAKGKRDGKTATFTWEMVDLYDRERNITSMAKTTAFPAVVVADWMARGKIADQGVLPIEQLITGEKFHAFMTELKKRGITISFNKN